MGWTGVDLWVAERTGINQLLHTQHSRQTIQPVYSYCSFSVATSNTGQSVERGRRARPRTEREREWKMLPLLLLLLQLPRCPPSEVFAACNGGRFRPVSHRPTLYPRRPSPGRFACSIFSPARGCARCLLSAGCSL